MVVEVLNDHVNNVVTVTMKRQPLRPALWETSLTSASTSRYRDTLPNFNNTQSQQLLGPNCKTYPKMPA